MEEIGPKNWYQHCGKTVVLVRHGHRYVGTLDAGPWSGKPLLRSEGYTYYAFEYSDDKLLLK